MHIVPQTWLKLTPGIDVLTNVNMYMFVAQWLFWRFWHANLFPCMFAHKTNTMLPSYVDFCKCPDIFRNIYMLLNFVIFPACFEWTVPILW
jgi:hypothetical protein